MWLGSHVQLLALALINNEPHSLMSTSNPTALPPPPCGGFICPRHVGLYHTGPPPLPCGGLIRPPTCFGVGLRFIVVVTLGWVALASFIIVTLHLLSHSLCQHHVVFIIMGFPMPGLHP